MVQTLKIKTGRLHQFCVFWGRWSSWNQRILIW